MRWYVIDKGEIEQFKEQSYHSRPWTNLLNSIYVNVLISYSSFISYQSSCSGRSQPVCHLDGSSLQLEGTCFSTFFVVFLTHSPHWESHLLSEECNLISYHKTEIQKHCKEISTWHFISPSACFLLWAVTVFFTIYSTIYGAEHKPGPSSKGVVIWTWNHTLLYKRRNLSCLYRVLYFPQCPITEII